MTPFFSWLAKLATDLQQPAVIAAATAVLVRGASALVPKVNYTARAAGIILWTIGGLILAWGLLLVYAKLRDPSVKVPTTALKWMPVTGFALLVIAWYLRWRRKRAVSNRLSGLAEVAEEHIHALREKLGAMPLADQTTTYGYPVVPLLMSLVRQRGRGRRIVLVGELGSGKTATLLKFAMDCRLLRSTQRRSLIAIYVDLAEYAAQTTGNLQLREFIVRQFSDPNIQKDLAQAWDDPGLDVSWIFLFDNADEAELRWGARQHSWHLEVTDFAHRRSGLAPFHVVIATRMPPESLLADHFIELDGLTPAGRDKLLTHARVNPTDVTALTMDKSLDWYLTDPVTLELLAPTLASRTWTTSDNVYEAMGNAIDRRIQSRQQSPPKALSSIRATATAANAFLFARPGTLSDAPGEMKEIIKHVASVRHCTPRSIDSDLRALANCGIAKRTPGQSGTEYLEFGPAVAAYFYTSALREDPSQIRARDLLLRSCLDLRSRLAAVSLLKVADNGVVASFADEAGRILDQAIERLPAKPAPQAGAPHPAELANSVEQAYELADLVRQAYVVLSVLVNGVQTRLELLHEPLRAKSIDFITRAMPFAKADVQAGLLEVSYTLGTPEQAMSTMAFGLDTRDDVRVLDAATRLVNAMSDLTELDDVHRGQLVTVIIMTGLRSLTLNRGRGDVPYALRWADGVGVAAIILYGTVFGLGGLLQLFEFRRDLFPQIGEVLVAMIVVCPMVAARYLKRWRRFVLGADIRGAMERISSWLAIAGTVGAISFILYDLATFSMPLMPLLVCYSLVWPVAVLFYMVSEPRPTIANVIFPLPRIILALWRARRGGGSRADRNDRQPLPMLNRAGAASKLGSHISGSRSLQFIDRTWPSRMPSASSRAIVPHPRDSTLLTWTFDHTGACGLPGLSHVPTMSASLNSARNIAMWPCRTPLSWQKAASDDMKSSPCSNATANVRPGFSSLVFISVPGFYVVVRYPARWHRSPPRRSARYRCGQLRWREAGAAGGGP